ncbi:DUF349 domain-containing protein [Bdellovibrionota bacterium FG-2]
MSSFFEKLKNTVLLRNRGPQPPAVTESESNSQGPIAPGIQEAHLRSLNDEQLRDFFRPLSEREIVRFLRTLTDTELQLRMIKGIDQEATLKRVARSDINKKIKRAAEKKLREAGTPGQTLKLQKIAQLSLEIEKFIQHPERAQWERARELLDRVADRSLTEGPLDEASAPVAHFLGLRKSLAAQIDEFEHTCAEMEKICDQIAPSKTLFKSRYREIQDRWKDLEEKYFFPKSFEAIELYAKNVRLRAEAPLSSRTSPTPSIATAAATPVQADNHEAAHRLQQRREQKEKNEREAREARRETLEAILKALQETSENLDNRQAGSRLRQLQNEISELRRWRKEFAGKLEEAETLIRSALSKRTQIIDESQWDTWARTDRASRIQAELEKTIGQLESEADPETALEISIGLGSKLFDFAKEMRELGTLEREKDHKIWEQFKALTDRGWIVCDKMRSHVLGKLKLIFSEHAAHPIDFSMATLTAPRASLAFKVTAFENEVTDRVKALQSLWMQIGSKSNDANREAEIVFAKLFELYFKQVNLNLGQLQRIELKAVQLKQVLLLEMKRACEGRIAPLVQRARDAKKLEERWKRDPLPASAAEQLQGEFESYRSALHTEITTEAERLLTLALELATTVQAVINRLVAKDGAKLSLVFKLIATLENELAALEKNLNQLKEVTQLAAIEARFQDARDRVKALLTQASITAKNELADRASERNKILNEAETLTLSTDWDSSRTRFEELRGLWKKANAIGKVDDAQFDFYFEHLWRFYLSRAEGNKQAVDAAKKDKILKQRKELLFSLEALTKFLAPTPGVDSAVGRLPLPLEETELSKAAGKVLEMGLKYKQILSFNPADGPEGGTLKEAKKIMAEWSQLGLWDGEQLPAFWNYYLSQIRLLLKLVP